MWTQPTGVCFLWRFQNSWPCFVFRNSWSKLNPQHTNTQTNQSDVTNSANEPVSRGFKRSYCPEFSSGFSRISVLTLQWLTFNGQGTFERLSDLVFNADVQGAFDSLHIKCTLHMYVQHSHLYAGQTGAGHWRRNVPLEEGVVLKSSLMAVLEP